MKQFLRLLAVAMFLQLPFLAGAQPEFEDDVNDVPVDGGISALILAGAAYGAKRMYDYKKKNQVRIHSHDNFSH
jgi:hypothetical protein